MRSEPNIHAERFRIPNPPSDHGANWGAFQVGHLRIISSGVPQSGDPPWEHVSVSLAHRCPTWDEMQRVKRMFWSDDETVIQFHPKSDAYVNVHPNCLHLWRKVGADYELPPRNLIA